MLYTIGHTNHSYDVFLELLQKYNITYLLDVRSTPFSQYTSQFNRDQLEDFLRFNNIKYFHMGKFFGARPKDKSLYTKENYLDFEKARASELFQKGMTNVIKGLNGGENIVLMCTEKDPIDCHRAIMVARGFELKGIKANHIMPDGTLQSQDELNNRLLEKYFPDRYQLSLVSNMGEIPDEELLIKAYRQRNREIGYHNDDL